MILRNLIPFTFVFCQGTDAIEGITLDLSQIEEIHLSPDALKKMNNLRFLKLCKSPDQCSSKNNIYLSGTLEPFSCKLAYIEWNGYPLKSLPPTFCAKLLVEIRMPHSHVKQLWNGLQVGIYTHIHMLIFLFN